MGSLTVFVAAGSSARVMRRVQILQAPQVGA
jgi:hypothetical protein